MKKLFLYLLILVIANSCSNVREGTIQFIPLNENDFNYASDTTFAIPKGKMWKEQQRLHDSCMGSSYAANAIFIRTKDTFMLGCIVDRKTMQIKVKGGIINFTRDEIFSMLTIETKPCYEKRTINTTLDTFFNKRINLLIPGASNAVNQELNQAIRSSNDNEIETGSWVNMELNTLMGEILDTTTSAQLRDYKKALLDSNNMVLVRSSSLSNVKFFIHSTTAFSKSLQLALAKNPVTTIPGVDLSPTIYLQNEHDFQVNFVGNFQLMGQFMRCKLQ